MIHWMWEVTRPWEGQCKSIGTDGSKWEEQELKDDDGQTRFWRRRPDGFSVNEKEHIIYVLKFKMSSDAGEGYVTKTQRVAIHQQLAVTQGL